MAGEYRLFAPDEKQIQDTANIAFEVDEPSRKKRTDGLDHRVLASGTREIDPRVLVQHGSFTVHSDDTPLGKVRYKLKRKGKSVPWRYCFRVPANKKEGLRHTLTRFAVTKAILFPDLGSLAEYLKTVPFAA